VTPELTLSLDVMEPCSTRYGASWTERMRELLEVFGAFNLGFLEALLRAADQRASAAGPTSSSPKGSRGK
jgi:CRISPR-associated endonuclease/helicase Cas3